MEEEKISDLEALKKLLKICEINDNVINQIVEVCQSIEDFYKNVNAWSKMVEEEEQIRLIKCANRIRYATIEAEEYCELNSTRESGTSFEKYYAYAEKYGAEVDQEIKKYKQQIYKLALTLYLQPRKLTTAVNVVAGGTIVFAGLKDIVLKIVKIAESNPSVMKGIGSSLDEVIGYFAEIKLISAIKGNLISGAICFGIMTVYSVGKNVYGYYKGELSAKQCLTLIGIDVAANAASVLTTTVVATLGSFLGSLIFPGIGTIIGGIVGGLIGTMIGNKVVDPLVKKMLAGAHLTNSQNKDSDCQAQMKTLYDEALKDFNVTDKAPADLVKTLRRKYILCFHPDKQDSLNDAQTQKFIHLEACYKIIESYRTAKGTWK